MTDIIDFEEKRKKKLEEEGNGKLADDLGPREVGCELQDELREDRNGNGFLSNALSAPGKKPTQAELLIQLAQQSATFFQTPSMEPFGCIEIGDHQEIWPLRSKPFRMWLLRLMYESIKKLPYDKAVEDALTQLQGDALFNGPCHEVFIRFANHDEAIYVDMADEDWNQIEITKKGWQKIAGKDSPVKFMRTQGMLPIPNPSQQGSINVLSEFLNLESQTEFQLIVGWLIGAAQPSGPFPIMLLQGEQGSAKSTTARLLRSIIDPSTIPLRTLPRSERDLLIAAGKCWVMNFDNLSGLADWLSDALCRIATCLNGAVPAAATTGRRLTWNIEPMQRSTVNFLH